MAGDINNTVSDPVLQLTVTSNTTLTIPAGYIIQGVYLLNTTANAVTGGIVLGTTNGGVDVMAAFTIGANFLGHVTDALLLKRFFSTSVDTTLYLQAAVAWNSASLTVRIPIRKLF